MADVFAAEPRLLSVEILRRARLAGYGGGKSALYEVIASLRPPEVAVEMRFEGLPASSRSTTSARSTWSSAIAARDGYTSSPRG